MSAGIALEGTFNQDGMIGEWKLNGAKPIETVRDGLTRRAFDAVVTLTKQVQNGDLPIAHAFHGLTALYETIYPFCSQDGKAILDQVLSGWKTQIAAEAAREIEVRRSTEILIAQPAGTTQSGEEPWG